MTSPPQSDTFERFVSLLLPGGGHAVTVCEVYIDESIEQEGPPILCVAGYVFRKSKAIQFSRVWAKYLRGKNLPYFHMSECAQAKGIFEGRADCDEIARELIGLTKAYTEFGFAISLNQDDYDELIGPHEGMRSAYAFALLAGMHHVQRWRERTGITGPTAFLFESGHKNQGEADNWLTWMLCSKRLANGLGYRGEHAFVPKVTPGLHPADNLSWHWRLETVRAQQARRKRPVRKDFRELWREKDIMAQFTRARLMDLQHEIHTKEEDQSRMISAAIESGVMPPAIE